MRLEVLVPPSPSHTATGRALHLLEPISFWGGVSSTEGTLTDPRCAHYGETIAGRVLLIRALRGSSSGSSVLLELVYRGKAPSAIILTEPDAIVAVGALVAREMGWSTPGIFRLAVEQQQAIAAGVELSIGADGAVSGTSDVG